MKATKDLNYYLSLKYPFLIQQDNDNTYFLSYPDLPGCMTCSDSLENVLKMGEDAKISWLEIALQDNKNIPEPSIIKQNYSGEFRIRMPKELHKDLAEAAEKDNISMNQYCIYLLSKMNEKYKFKINKVKESK